MLSEKPWKVDAVGMLVLGVSLSVVTGMVAGFILQQFLPEDVRLEQTFYRFVLNSVSLHGVPVILVTIFLRYHGVGWGEFLGLTSPRVGRNLVLALTVAVLVLPVALGLSKLCAYLIELLHYKPVDQAPVQVLKQSVTLGKRIWFGIEALLLAPVVEETFFRGILYPLIKQMGKPRAALWGTSLFFAAIHDNLVTFVPLTVFAVVLVLLYEKTDALMAPILTHAAFNAANFFLLIYETEVAEWLRVVGEGLH